MNPATKQARVPLPAPIFRLSEVFRKAGRSLYGVGGAFRDFLIHEEYNTENPESFLKNIKDVDLATEAHPAEVARILSLAGIRNFEKGESFGVWVAHIDRQDFEIATFREDIGSSDGRHPDEVRFCTPEEDYKRRDFTINAIFYQIPETSESVGTLIDFGGGIGFEHIKERRIVAVGDAMERFREDKLRALRAVRFYCRFHKELIFLSDTIDPDVYRAIWKFRDLRAHGISGPRIMSEFVRGLEQAKSPVNFFISYYTMGLFPAVFPGLTSLEISPIMNRHWGDYNDWNVPRLVQPLIAVLLRRFDPDEVREELNKCNYSNDISDEVAWLLKARRVFLPHNQEISARAMAAGKVQAGHSQRSQFFEQFGKLLQDEVDYKAWKHAETYHALKVDGEQIMREYNVTGSRVGEIIRDMQVAHYVASLG